MKKFILGLFFIALVLILFNKDRIFAEDTGFSNNYKADYVRVGISDNSFNKYLFNNISLFSPDDDIVVTDNSTAEVEVKSGKIVNIYYKDNNFEVFDEDKLVLKTKSKIKIIPASGKNIAIYGLKRKSKQAMYSGIIELEISKTSPDKFAIVNVLPLQTYLKGVVPNEMPTHFGLEALKAQAILARNYVLKPREKYYKEFDICDSVACQVYFGSNTYEKLSNQAVDETENIVATYNDDLILAVYSSTAGGYTESYKNAFLNNTSKGIMAQNIPYLVSVPDIENTPVLNSEEKTREFYKSLPETHDNNSPYFRWTKEWKLKDLENILTKTLPTVKSTGFVKTTSPVDYSNKNFLGHIKSIYVNKRGDSGKIVALTIITDKNQFTVYKELIIRKVFLHDGKILPSANVFFDFVKDENSKETKVVATGGGLGHGVGMSQWGAGSMAKKGFKFHEIIKHYYKDVKLSVLPVVLAVDKPVTQQFYLSSKKAELKLKNKLHFSDLVVIINNKQLDENEMKELTSSKKLDISRHLKRGKNIITYQLAAKNKNQIKIWIVTEE